MTACETAIRRYLDFAAQMYGGRTSPERLVCARGRLWICGNPQKPTGVRLRREKYCFKNAATIAMRDPTFVYAEGWAMRPNLGIPLHHAVVIDTATKSVVETTWRNAIGSVYLLVPIRIEHAIASLVRTGVYGAFSDRELIATPLEQWEALR